MTDGIYMSESVRGVDETPAFVFDEQAILKAVDLVASLGASSGCNILFAVKALSLVEILRLMASRVDGLAVSSLFEACLAREACDQSGTVHFTAPCLRADEIDIITDLCDYISFNSLSQWSRFGQIVVGRASCGLRVNPRLSFVDDIRYSPCRKHSKLGVPLDTLVEAVRTKPDQLHRIRGLHFHTNCDSSDFSQLLATVRHLDKLLPTLLDRVEWVNVGGGYLFDEAGDFAGFSEAVHLLKSKYGVTVFAEPGAALVREAGFLVSSVVDLFESDGKSVAVLDTTVNHWPEVFEYQFEPDVVGHVDSGRYGYVLAGCTCLGGDVFGEYAFEQPLEVGSRVVFANAGAYSLVKAHMFNGVNLPTIYVRTETGELLLTKRFTYDDFATRWGAVSNVII